MADIEITCPECGNRRGVPADLIGKKIKCKKCQSVFTVKGGNKPGKPTSVTASPDVIPIKKDEEEDDKNPYIMRDENLAARCPFCAQLMDPPDAKICIHCGYDMLKRRRVESKVTYEVTVADYILHHLPTAGCFIGIAMIVGFAVFFVMHTEEWVVDSWFEDVLPVGCWDTWCVVFSLIPIWFAGRFIFRRFVWYFHPTEKEKKGVEED